MEDKENKLLNNLTSIYFNPLSNKKEEKCDIKSLLYLMNISASSAPPNNIATVRKITT